MILFELLIPYLLQALFTLRGWTVAYEASEFGKPQATLLPRLATSFPQTNAILGTALRRHESRSRLQDILPAMIRLALSKILPPVADGGTCYQSRVPAPPPAAPLPPPRRRRVMATAPPAPADPAEASAPVGGRLPGAAAAAASGAMGWMGGP
jgi:hypothetical protein